jgi:hypothetical protein
MKGRRQLNNIKRSCEEQAAAQERRALESAARKLRQEKERERGTSCVPQFCIEASYVVQQSD